MFFLKIFEKVKEYFNTQLQLSACGPVSVSCTTVAISIHTAALFWQDCRLPDPSCPAATERFMAPFRLFTFSVSFVISCDFSAHSHPNCHFMHFACGCVKLSHSLWPQKLHRTCILSFLLPNSAVFVSQRLKHTTAPALFLCNRIVFVFKERIPC